MGALVDKLVTHSGHFRERWTAHDVHVHRRGNKRFRHSVVGDLHLSYEALQIAGDDDLTMVCYTAERGTPSEEALDVLGMWAASDALAEITTPYAGAEGD